jgi:hypothetical protein
MIWTGESTKPVQLTAEALGLYAVWYLVVTVGVLALLSLRRRGLLAAARATARALVIIALYAVFRFGVLVALAVEFARPGLLWQHASTVASWLPLALVLRLPEGDDPAARVAGVSGGVGDGRAVRVSRAVGISRAVRISRAALPMLAGLCLAFATAYNDPGCVKRGRVVIDESHSNWEWTRERFDTTAFGIRAEYNYYCLSEYLSHFYEVTTVGSDSVRPLSEILEAADVLVIKTPTRPFAESEIDAIVQFVELGGGLLLIGDHTNLFGMSTYLNSIAARFGTRFRFDDTFDVETTGFSAYRRPLVWFHPAVRGIGAFEFLTSCTVEGGRGIEPVMIGCGLGSEEVDYGHPNFFGDIAFDLPDRFGLFLQAAAKRYGKGRVLLFTDSTCFSNFCMFSPGKPEAVLGFIDYLNRCGTRHPHARQAGLVLSCALIGALLATARGMGAGRRAATLALDRRVAHLVLGAGLAFVAGTAATSYINARLYGPIEAARPLASAVFENHHSDASFFDYMGISVAAGDSRFEELYMCAARMGLHPRSGSIADLNNTPPLGMVLVNPVRGFSNADVGKVARYVSQGGTLVVMDRGGAGRSTANQVLRPFGLEVRTVPVAAKPVAAPASSGRRDTDFHPALALLGADIQPLGNPPFLNVLTKAFGKGRVVVCLNSYRYCEAVVGRPLARSLPEPDVVAIFREVFAILDFRATNAPPAPIAPIGSVKRCSQFLGGDVSPS